MSLAAHGRKRKAATAVALQDPLTPRLCIYRARGRVWSHARSLTHPKGRDVHLEGDHRIRILPCAATAAERTTRHAVRQLEH